VYQVTHGILAVTEHNAFFNVKEIFIAVAPLMAVIVAVGGWIIASSRQKKLFQFQLANEARLSINNIFISFEKWIDKAQICLYDLANSRTKKDFEKNELKARKLFLDPEKRDWLYEINHYSSLLLEIAGFKKLLREVYENYNKGISYCIFLHSDCNRRLKKDLTECVTNCKEISEITISSSHDLYKKAEDIHKRINSKLLAPIHYGRQIKMLLKCFVTLVKFIRTRLKPFSKIR
jgi:hypothetical protein